MNKLINSKKDKIIKINNYLKYIFNENKKDYLNY